MTRDGVYSGAISTKQGRKMKDYYFIQYEDGDTEFVHADRTCDDSFCVQAALNKTVSEAKNKNNVVKKH